MKMVLHWLAQIGIMFLFFCLLVLRNYFFPEADHLNTPLFIAMLVCLILYSAIFAKPSPEKLQKLKQNLTRDFAPKNLAMFMLYNFIVITIMVVFVAIEHAQKN